MKKIIVLIISCFAIGGLLTAQTLNVQVGQVKYQFPAEQAGEMTYAEGTTLDIMNNYVNFYRKRCSLFIHNLLYFIKCF